MTQPVSLLVFRYRVSMSIFLFGLIASGIIACIGVIPLAHLAGPLRGIPMYWRWLDCMFGILGAIPLVYCLRLQKQISQQ